MARALAYPYEAPADSFLLDLEAVRPLEPAEVEPSGRTPLLAYGSNAAPEVLSRKLGTSLEADPVPAVRVMLRDFDVVYSKHVSRYGSIPATLERSPGTQVGAFVLYLTEPQMSLLSPTEPNYELVGLRQALCSLEGAESPSGVVAYLSRHGPLVAAQSKIALAPIEARGRRLPEMTQRQALEHVRSVVAPELSLEDLVSEAAADPEAAARYTAALKTR